MDKVFRRATDNDKMPTTAKALQEDTWRRTVDTQNLMHTFSERLMKLEGYVYGGEGRKSVGAEINSLWTAHTDCRNNIMEDIRKVRQESNSGDWRVLGKVLVIVGLLGSVIGGVMGALVAALT